MSRKLKRRLLFYPSLFVVYFFTIVFGGCADRLILFPTTAARNAHGAVRHTIDDNGREIEIWTARSPAAGAEPEAFVLEFCGNATRAEDITTYVAGRWANLPVEVWVMNYPGFGGSAGSASLSSIAPSAERAFDVLKAKAGDRPIFVAGNSLGTAAALHIGATRAVAGLILQNPPPLRQVIWHEHGWWNAWLLAAPAALSVPGALDSISNARQCTVPAVFVQSSADDVIPTKYQDMVINAYKGPRMLMTLRDADHNWSFTNSQNQEMAMHLAWLWVKGANRPTPSTQPAR